MKILLYLLLCMSSGIVNASPDITFKGTLVLPPACTISDGNTIEVEFRDVIIDSIDGNNGREVVPYDTKCDAVTPGSSWDMTLTWIGTQTSYDDAAIETDVTGLGIKLRQNGQPFRVNTPIQINADTKPQLEAVPVKAVDAVLTDGTFSASATLRVEYQ